MIARIPPRVAARPDPNSWAPDELMTMTEAAALLWPDGPLTQSSLRTAYRQGVLEVTVVARKILVTRAQLGRMAEAGRTVRAPKPSAGGGRAGSRDHGKNCSGSRAATPANAVVVPR